jgi:glycosyltransferase involved in cell wall biosynthesis
VNDPIRILELRSVWGTGGGPEKTILLGAQRADPSRFAVTVCYVRQNNDTVFGIQHRAGKLNIDYVEVGERSPLDYRAWTALRELVRSRRIDIVHAHDYKTDLMAWGLARYEQVIPLTTAHGWTGHSRRERWVYYPAEKRIMRGFPAVIAVSGEIRAELIRSGVAPQRVSVVLNGIDHLAFRKDPARRQLLRQRLELHDDDVLIGSVGRLEPQKRFDLLIEAVCRLRVTNPRLKLAIAGEGSLRADLEAQLKRLGAEAHCRLLGHLDDVPAFYCGLDLFAQSSAYEGTPNVVLEAMAFEVPIVATAVGGTAELIRDGVDGLLVEPGSVDQLAAAITTVLDYPAAAATRTASARLRVETDLSFATRMQHVERIYERLIDNRRRSADRDGRSNVGASTAA